MMVLKLSETIEGNNGCSIIYHVENGSFWITFRNLDGFGPSIVLDSGQIGDQAAADYLAKGFHRLENSKIEDFRVVDSLYLTEIHYMLMQMLNSTSDQVIVQHTVGKSGKDRPKSPSWQTQCSYEELVGLAQSLEEYFND